MTYAIRKLQYSRKDLKGQLEKNHLKWPVIYIYMYIHTYIYIYMSERSTQAQNLVQQLSI